MSEIEGDITQIPVTAKNIRRSARRNLYRSLNIRRVVAFVGAGLSLAYGRLGWQALADAVWFYLEERLAKIEKPWAEDNAADGPCFPDMVVELRGTLKAIHNPEADEQHGPDALMLSLELCERIETEVNRVMGAGTIDLRTHVKELVRDDRAYARHHFSKRIKSLTDSFKSKPRETRGDGKLNIAKPTDLRLFYNTELRRNLSDALAGELEELTKDGSEELKKDRLEHVALQGLRKLRSVFWLGAFQEMNDGVEVDIGADLEKRLRGRADSGVALLHPAGGKIEVMPSDRRSLFTVYFAMAQAVRCASESRRGKFETDINFLADAATAREPLRPPSIGEGLSADSGLFTTDGVPSMVPYLRPSVDPIDKLFRDLGVRRFLTTNYDLELERYLEHGDFPLGDFTTAEGGSGATSGMKIEYEIGDSLEKAETGSASEGVDQYFTIKGRSRIGRDARSSVLRLESAAALVEFAVGAPELYVDIFHLHGRALQESDPLVLTESDYQQTYMRTDEDRRVFKEALSVVFESNPILFVGTGMREDDLLRPLRQFVSNRPEKLGRPLFALLPATDKPETRDAKTLDFYIKYGVQTIYFGAGPQDGDGIEGEDANRLYENFHPLAKSYAGRSKPNPGVNAGSLGSLADEYGFLSKLIAALKLKHDRGSTPAKRVKLRKAELKTAIDKFEAHTAPKSANGAGVEWKKLPELAEADDGLTCYQDWLWHRMPRLAASLVDRELFPFVLHALRLSVARPDPISNGLLSDPAAHSLVDYLERLQEKLVTLALTQELEFMGQCWKHWSRKWKDTPEARQGELARASVGEGSKPQYVNKLRHALRMPQTLVRVDAIIPQEGASFPSNLGWDERVVKFGEVWQNKLSDLKREVRPGDAQKDAADERYRALLLVKIPEGGGKGLFFNQLQINPEPWRTAPGGSPAWTHSQAFFVNTTFSSEFTSIIEGTIKFLEETAECWSVRNTQSQNRLRGSRARRLTEALDALVLAQRDGDYVNDRAVLILNNADMMFDASSRPLTSELQGFLNTLLSHEMAPLDIILISRPETAGGPPISLQTQYRRLAAKSGSAANTEDDTRPDDDSVISALSLGPIPFCTSDIEATASRSQFLAAGFDLTVSNRLKSLSGFYRYLFTQCGVGSNYASRNAEEQDPENIWPDLELDPAAAPGTDPVLRKVGDDEVGQAILQEMLDDLAQIYVSTGRCLFTQSLIIAALHETRSDIAGCRRWIGDLHQIATSGSASKARDEIVELVIDCYMSESHRAGLPGDRARHALDNMIMRHLAYINTPVDAMALAACPEIEQLFRQNRNSWGVPKPVDWAVDEIILKRDGVVAGQRAAAQLCLIDLIHESCARLLRRSLVVKVHPRQETLETPRFALHRHMRTYVLRRLGRPRRDLGEANLYDLSVVSAQPRDLPVLDFAQYRFASNLAAALCAGLPESPKPGDAAETGSTIGIEDELRYRSRNSQLRAALGLMRSTLSLPNLLRLPEVSRASGRAGSPVLDIHLTRLRDLASSAQDWEGSIEASTVHLQARYSAGPEFGVRQKAAPALAGHGLMVARAFYTDELVWIYNERGTTALTQGRLYDAMPLFQKAAEVNSEIESETGQSNGARIRLNQAVANIERGNFVAAERLLKQVCQIENEAAELIGSKSSANGDDERGSKLPPTHVGAAAFGFQGLILHFRGRYNEAASHYEGALKVLERQERHRGISMFYRFLGDMERARGDFDKARKAIANSIMAAESSRHLDLLHFARVAEIRTFDASSARMSEALSRIEAAREYASAMGLYSLESFVATAHGGVMLSHGENKIAGEMAVQALSAATDHGMRLRRINAMMLLAGVTLRRDLPEQGIHMATNCLRMAERLGYNLAVERAQRLILNARQDPRFDFAIAEAGNGLFKSIL